MSKMYMLCTLKIDVQCNKINTGSSEYFSFKDMKMQIVRNTKHLVRNTKHLRTSDNETSCNVHLKRDMTGSGREARKRRYGEEQARLNRVPSLSK